MYFVHAFYSHSMRGVKTRNKYLLHHGVVDLLAGSASFLVLLMLLYKFVVLVYHEFMGLTRVVVVAAAASSLTIITAT